MKDINLNTTDYRASSMSCSYNESGDAPMRLRPHHLLCTQGYEGKGYSQAFARNMTHYVSIMRSNPDFRVTLTAVPDDLCVCCPNKLDDVRCKDDCKVLAFDRNVMEIFNLEYDRTYQYQDLIRRIDDVMTPAKMRQICGNCSWYDTSACERNAVSGKHIIKK